MVSEERESNAELASEMIPVPQVRPVQVSEDQTDAPDRKKSRVRKKALNAAILKQMEFYFGDANLSKDRFLGGLVSVDPYIDLSVFLRFNKIRALTNETSRLAKALSGSSMLVLSEDGTKVRRATPVSPRENVDECTVYVQNLPPDATHEWLSGVFSRYGPVAYVSLPRYKSNKKIKGFAFVEFEKPETAEKCIEAFEQKGRLLPPKTTPEELLSITTFEETEQTTKTEETTRDEGGMEIVSAEQEKERTREKSAVEEDDEIKESKKAKRKKRGESEVVETDSIENPTSGQKETKESKRAKKRKSKGGTERANGDELDESNVEVGIKDDGGKLRERKRAKPKNCEENEKDVDNDKKIEDIGLEGDTDHGGMKLGFFKVSKESRDDTSMREEYDDRAEANRKTRKHKASREEVLTNLPMDSSECGAGNEENLGAESARESDEVEERKRKRKRKRRSKNESDDDAEVGLQIMSKKEWKKLRNKYLQLQRCKMKSLKQHLRRTRWNQSNLQWSSRETKGEKDIVEEKVGEKEKVSEQRFQFIPGVILKIELDEPCVDPKSYKAEFKGNNGISYTDATEGCTEAFIRCDSAESAKALLDKYSKSKSMSILTGTEEKKYWEKMVSDREKRLSQKPRVKQRGRDKLLKRAEKELGKHIKFDEV